MNQFAEIAEFAVDHAIDLIVIGPDDPLSEGIVDFLEAKQLTVFGPRQNAAIIESSKVFSKELFKKYHIPTAAYESFDNYEAALAYLHSQQIPIVIKADGLAAGKGVIIPHSMEEAEKALHDIMVAKIFGESGNQVVIEEFMTGQEMSILSFVDGNVVRPMVAAQDHKTVFDNDKGPNTGAWVHTHRCRISIRL